VISHLPIIHCQHDARISNPIRVISQRYSKGLSHPVQKMSQVHNGKESWGCMTPASLSVRRIPCLSPYQRWSLSHINSAAESNTAPVPVTPVSHVTLTPMWYTLAGLTMTADPTTIDRQLGQMTPASIHFP
jgi:hypothetical protein